MAIFMWLSTGIRGLQALASRGAAMRRCVAPALTEWFQQFPRKTETPKQGGHIQNKRRPQSVQNDVCPQDREKATPCWPGTNAPQPRAYPILYHLTPPCTFPPAVTSHGASDVSGPVSKHPTGGEGRVQVARFEWVPKLRIFCVFPGALTMPNSGVWHPQFFYRPKSLFIENPFFSWLLLVRRPCSLNPPSFLFQHAYLVFACSSNLVLSWTYPFLKVLEYPSFRFRDTSIVPMGLSFASQHDDSVVVFWGVNVRRKPGCIEIYSHLWWMLPAEVGDSTHLKYSEVGI